MSSRRKTMSYCQNCTQFKALLLTFFKHRLDTARTKTLFYAVGPWLKTKHVLASVMGLRFNLSYGDPSVELNACV